MQITFTKEFRQQLINILTSIKYVLIGIGFIVGILFACSIDSIPTTKLMVIGLLIIVGTIGGAMLLEWTTVKLVEDGKQIRTIFTFDYGDKAKSMDDD